MNKIVDGDKPFVYQEFYGVHITKLIYEKKALFGPKLRYTRLTEIQKAKIDGLAIVGYEMINGYAIHGKVFSDPNDNKSGVWVDETNVILIAKEGQRGCVAILPNGEVHALTNKAWVPSAAHFGV